MATGTAGMGDPEIMAMKVWKKSRSIGLVSLPDINLLKSPIEAYASREDLREHVDKLKKSFLRTQNCNRKGISFCASTKPCTTSGFQCPTSNALKP